MTCDLAMDAWLLRTRPYVVTNVRCNVSLVFVSQRNDSILFRRAVSYADVISYSPEANFISQRFVTRSPRWMTRSIWAPLRSLPSPFFAHADSSVATPDIPRAAFICRVCWRQIRSKARPSHVTQTDPGFLSFGEIQSHGGFYILVR